jgi:hypothetical protein
MGDGPTDAQEVKEILDVVSEKVPDLLNALTDVLYGAQQSGKYGQAIAGFYKAMKESGMTDEQAFELTQQYMSTLNLPGLLGKALSGREGPFKGKVTVGGREAEA